MPRGNKARYLSRAVDESLDVPLVIEQFERLILACMADGVIEPTEQASIFAMIERLKLEAREATEAAERANVAELVLEGMRRDGGPSKDNIKRARELGIPVVFLGEEPTPIRRQDLGDAA